MNKYEEQIGVRLPDGRRYMATVLVGPLESDEEILVRMTKEVGTIFNVNAQKLLVVSLNPFKIKNITDQDEEPPAPKREPKPVPQVKSASETESAPKSERRPAPTAPAVGETWRPKDPRRIASFVVKEIRGDEVLTDDGRSISLNRFGRYVRVESQTTEKLA